MLSTNVSKTIKALKSIRLHPSMMISCQNLHVDTNNKIAILLFTNFHSKQNECLLLNVKTFRILKKIVLPVSSLYYSSASKTMFGIRQKSGISEEIKYYSFPGFSNSHNFSYQDRYHIPLGFFEERSCLIACDNKNSEFHILTMQELKSVKKISFAPYKETLSLVVADPLKLIFIALHESGRISIYSGETGNRITNYQNSAPLKRILGYNADVGALILLNEAKIFTSEEVGPLNFELRVFNITANMEKVDLKITVPIQNDISSCLLHIQQGQAYILEFFCDELNRFDLEKGKTVDLIKLPGDIKMKNRYFFEWEKALFKLIYVRKEQDGRKSFNGFICIHRNTMAFLN